MNFIWKYSEVNPSKDLTRLSQFAGTYTAATIDKATEVNQLIKEKDQKINHLEEQLIVQKQKSEQLEEQLNLEKQKIDQQAIQRQQQLSQELEQLKLTHQQEIKSIEEKITQLQLSIEQFKDYPEVEEFKKEALEANKALSQQLNLLCQKISLIDPLCITTTSLIDQEVNTRLEFEDADDKVTDYLSWQSIEDGRAAK